jgi:hypothetical protein
MGSIGIISLTTRRNRRSSICRNIPVVKVRPALSSEPHDARLAPIRRPAIRWSVTSALAGRSRIRGSFACCVPDCWLASGMDPNCSILRPTPTVRSGGGDEETRTPDPLLAKEMLYQLSYVPGVGVGDGGRFWTRTRDLCLIRAVL